jgi:hypothetical protein
VPGFLLLFLLLVQLLVLLALLIRLHFAVFHTGRLLLSSNILPQNNDAP